MFRLEVKGKREADPMEGTGRSGADEVKKDGSECDPVPEEVMEALVARAKLQNKLGTLFQAKGQKDKARQLYTRSLSLHPNFSFARLNLASLYAEEGEHELALRHFQRACHDEPTLSHAWSSVAGTLMKMKRFAAALPALSRALELDPLNTDAQYTMNVALRCTNQHDAAVRRSWGLVDPKGVVLTRVRVRGSGLPSSTPSSSLGHVSVICVKYGKKYGPDYVNKLRRGVERHLTVPHTFFCLTDDPEDLGSEIRPILLEFEGRKSPTWRGWWTKALLFHPELPLSGRVLYIDLDTIITGPLDDVVRYEGGFATLSTQDFANEARSDGLNSSVMVWTAPQPSSVSVDGDGDSGDLRLVISEGLETKHGEGKCDEDSLPPEKAESTQLIFSALVALGKRAMLYLHRFDHWLEMIVPDADALQTLYPKVFVEYAGHCKDGIPEGASVINFPLHPKPHHVCEEVEWVRDHWR